MIYYHIPDIFHETDLDRRQVSRSLDVYQARPLYIVLMRQYLVSLCI